MKLKLLVMTGALAGLAYAGMTVSDFLGGSEGPAKAKAGPASARPQDDTPSSLSITATDEAGAAALAAARGETPFELREQTTPGELPEIQPDSVAGLSAPPAEPAPAAGEGDERSAPASAPPPRRGPLGVLTAIELHGQRTGVSCEHIEMPERPGAPYELAGHGEPAAVVAFLAALELDPDLGGATHLRVWSEGDRRLCFEALWAVPGPGAGAR